MRTYVRMGPRLAQPPASRDQGGETRTKRRRLDRRIAIQLGLDRVEQLAQSCRLDEATLQHLSHVVEILTEAALDLGERLGVEVEVMNRDVALPEDERTTVTPARQLWNEVRWRGQLYVQAEVILQRWKRACSAARAKLTMRATRAL